MEPAMTPSTGTSAAALPAACRTPEDFHPLEVIPFFRRWRPGLARDLLYTFIWNCGLGLVFWAIGMAFRPRGFGSDDLVANLLIANTIGYTLHAIFFASHKAGLDRWIRARGGPVTAAYYTGVSMLGVVVGFVIFAAIFNTAALDWLLRPRWLATMGISSAIISTIIAVIFFAREREARAQADLARERVRIERAEREAALANLRALQAQIEPHFLFNTLANVAGLVESDPGQAKRMLDSFNRFLRSSLAATRMDRTTLDAEGRLIAAFLDVLQVRMGARLRYRVAIAPEVAAFELPPMLLQPVVENAIRHGLEPKVEGGEVTVDARRDGDHVRIEVRDTGVGFAPTTRGGLGLTNLRDRLRLLYGERAGLEVGEGAGCGTVVAIRIPA
jgi:sensor histidine kinase YesM